MKAARAVRLAVISLGCPKNLVDTERALGQMLGARIVLVEDMADAQWVLVNTCGFIQDARSEAAETIRAVAALKETNPSLKIAVAGCLSERYGNKLPPGFPRVDFVIGLLTRDNVRRLAKHISGRAESVPYAEDDDRQRLRITPRHVGYLRISEGCDNRCTYCAIPDIRGPLRSRPFENVVADAAELLSDGVVELNVIAQDTTVYGIDLYGKYRLAELLAELARMNPKGWVRLLYAHPAHLADDVIGRLAEGWPLVPYVDLPLQHINDRILAAMGRKVTRSRVESLIARIRSRVPDVYLRTAFIVGFPSESAAEFDELLDFVKSARFEHLGAFTYSLEEGTAAAAFELQITEKEKLRRLDAIMTVQAGIVSEFNRSLVGRRIPGIIDGPSERDDLPLVGRTYGDAPDVDGAVYLAGPAHEGSIVSMKVTAVEGYDLIAEVVK